MKNTFIDDTVRTWNRVCDCAGKTNPLCTRKTFRMEDEYFRKNAPDDEKMKFEVAMSAENYVIAVAAVAVGVIVLMKISSCVRRSREKKRIERRMKQKYCRCGK